MLRESRVGRRRARHVRDLHRHRRLFDRRAGAARSEPAARRVADDDRPAVRVVRRDAAGRVDPDGRASDRIGRKAPLAGGLVVLAAATLLFAFADRLPWLFAARLVQGAADAVTWVVGFALIADLYGPDERGRVTGIVMSGTGFAFMIGPSLGGWLYEIGGARLPFIAVALAAAIGALAFVWLHIPSRRPGASPCRLAWSCACPPSWPAPRRSWRARRRSPMLEPVLALHLHTLGVGPARVGLVFRHRRRRDDGAASGVRPAGGSLGRAAADARRSGVVGLRASDHGSRMELRVGHRTLCRAGRSPGARHHAVAGVHGGSDVKRRHRIVRRRVRPLQHGVGRRSARRSRARRLSVRAAGLRQRAMVGPGPRRDGGDRARPAGDAESAAPRMS